MPFPTTCVEGLRALHAPHSPNIPRPPTPHPPPPTDRGASGRRQIAVLECATQPYNPHLAGAGPCRRGVMQVGEQNDGVAIKYTAGRRRRAQRPGCCCSGCVPALLFQFLHWILEGNPPFLVSRLGLSFSFLYFFFCFLKKIPLLYLYPDDLM